MKFLDYEIDPSKLFTQAEVLRLLKEGGEDFTALAPVRNRYCEDFGNELVWDFPISDGTNGGTYFVLVHEGVLSLPYDAVDNEVYELFELHGATLLDADAIQYCIDLWIPFSDDLLAAMKAMRQMVTPQEELPETAESKRACPKGCDPSAGFYTTAHVVQEWRVNQNGDFVATASECLEVTHGPHEDNVWTCVTCGEELPAKQS